VNKTALFVSLIVAVLGGFLLFAYLRRFEFESSGGAPVRVIVAKKQLDPGVVLTEELLATQIVPQAYVESRAVREAEKAKILGLRVSTPVQAQQSLMWTDLAIAADDQRYLSQLVQPGMRAVSVRAQYDDKSFALMRPGDRVDVVATFPQQAGQDQRTSIILLQNVLVLAVGLDTGAEGAGPRPPGDQRDLLLSVSVNIQEAQLLALAGEKGRLSVALRNPDDVRITDGLVDLMSSTLTDSKARKVVQDLRKTPTGPVKLPSATGAPQ